MLSRVANSLYWMSRYIERAESIARLVDVNLQLLLDFRSLDDAGLAGRAFRERHRSDGRHDQSPGRRRDRRFPALRRRRRCRPLDVRHCASLLTLTMLAEGLVAFRSVESAFDTASTL